MWLELDSIKATNLTEHPLQPSLDDELSRGPRRELFQSWRGHLLYSRSSSDDPHNFKPRGIGCFARQNQMKENLQKVLIVVLQPICFEWTYFTYQPA